MNDQPGLPFCSECGRILDADDAIACVRCEREFCQEHLVVASRHYLCTECESWRQGKRTDGSLFSTEERRVVQQLLADVRQTVGGDYQDVVLEYAEDAQLQAMSAPDPHAFEDFLVDEFQQYLHDTFVDASWPRCPDHPNHPLWLTESWWRCEQSGRRVAPLGGLAYSKPSAG